MIEQKQYEAYVIEQKLYEAALKSPELKSNFSMIEEKARQIHTNRKGIHLKGPRTIAAIACVILLFGTTVLAGTSKVNYGAWVRSTEEFSAVDRVATKLGVVLPDELNHSPFYSMSTLYYVTEGTTYLEALMTPAYTYYAVEYGNRTLVKEKKTDDWGTSIEESIEVKDAYALAVGSTHDECYHYVFRLDEDERRHTDKAVTNSYHTLDYAGVTLQMDTQLVEDKEAASSFYIYTVTWVDWEQSAVFQLSQAIYEEQNIHLPQELVEVAMDIVDMNRSMK